MKWLLALVSPVFDIDIGPYLDSEHQLRDHEVRAPSGGYPYSGLYYCCGHFAGKPLDSVLVIYPSFVDKKEETLR